MAVLLLTTDGRCWQAMEIKGSKAFKGQKVHQELKGRKVHKVHKVHKEMQELMVLRSIGAMAGINTPVTQRQMEYITMARRTELILVRKTRLRTLDLDTGNCWR